MAIMEQIVGDYLVLSPQGRLEANAGAEEFERQVQDRVAEGRLHLVVDLHAVSYLDSRGIRALVRAYTTTVRFGGSFRLVGPTILVRAALEITKLTNVLQVYDSVEAATRSLPT